MTSAFPERAGGPRIGSTLNAVGVAIVAYWLLFGGPENDSPTTWVVIVSLIALAAWLVRAFTRESIVTDVLAAVMLLAGAVTVQATDALMITPVIVAILSVTVDRRHRLALGATYLVIAAAIVTAGAILDSRPLSYLLGVLSGLTVGFVIGFNRRQLRIAAESERELLARSLEIEREQQHSALLADRARVARDIHDVLAHSLGGLVIQLDAVEALLENGRTSEAEARVTAARELAAEGLSEARRAVATLRDPDADGVRGRDAGEPAVAEGLEHLAGDGAPGSLDGSDAVRRLLETHESLGGDVTVSGLSALSRLDADHRRALAGVLREALSNARRHAAGQAVAVDLSIDESRAILLLRVANVLSGQSATTTTSAAATPGGGHGLRGMRERLAELDDGSRLVSGPRGTEFVIEAEVRVA